MCNKDICGKQMTITWHVDDLKISHDSDDTISEAIAWLKSIYGQLDASRGTKHHYFGMDLDYSDEGKVKIIMEQFTRKVIEEFPDPLTTTAESPAGENLFTAAPTAGGTRTTVPLDGGTVAFRCRASATGLPHRHCISDNSCI